MIVEECFFSKIFQIKNLGPSKCFLPFSFLISGNLLPYNLLITLANLYTDTYLLYSNLNTEYVAIVQLNSVYLCVWVKVSQRSLLQPVKNAQTNQTSFSTFFIYLYIYIYMHLYANMCIIFFNLVIQIHAHTQTNKNIKKGKIKASQKETHPRIFLYL